MQIRQFILLLIFIVGGCKSQNGQSEKHAYTNHLAGESSPYLLQHAHNPVDWHPWGEAALSKARKENKMLLISIGYAACHWCHVMEHESFEDTTVARIMNEHFVSIKVDREERPDVDDIYMTACQMATGQGCGWPLNAFALPDGRPVWAGTYFPKKQWVEILNYFVDIRKKEPEKLESYATQLTQGIAQSTEIALRAGDFSFSAEEMEKIAANFLKSMDLQKGGRQGAPKFPSPNNYEFLLRHHHRTGDEQALKAVKVTLDNMAAGGIYDHLGGGFARYSTDADWKVPHFEKMLYDNAQLVSLYAKAFKLTKNPQYEKVVRETLAFVERELTSPEGGFYSSLDADSEGEEGKFYVWEKTVIDSILADPTSSEIFADYYEIKKGGNWEHTNILYRRQNEEAIAKKHGISGEALRQLIADAKRQLFEARSKRVRPGLDDKILTAWNALMLEAYLDAYEAFGDRTYLDAALKNGSFLTQNMLQPDFRLDRNHKDGKSSINAFLDDYALSIQAFIALYEATFDETWLEKAAGLAEYVREHFFDASSGMFNYTSDIDPPLIARKMEVADDVIPGSNSSMARGLYYLGLYLYNEDYLSRSRQMMHNMEAIIVESDSPSFYSNWCILYNELIQPPYEIAIVGRNFEEIRKKLSAHYLPNAVFLGGKDEGSLDLLKNKLVEGQTMIYVCRNKVCKLPVTEVEKALALIE